MPLAQSLALRYRGGAEALEDLVQVASVGLLKALDRYDPAKQSDFVAFAAPTILGELRHHFRDNSWSVRLPRSLQERTAQVNGATERISAELQRDPTVDEIAAVAGLTRAEVLEAIRADEGRRTLSLDVPSNRGDEEPTSPMVESIGSIEDGFERIESNLAAGAAPLRPRERQALRLRFHEGLTQREIGARIGISQMQVSRLLQASLEKLLAAVRGGEEADETGLRAA
jgi:RNA polymerase sigma-B factor